MTTEATRTEDTLRLLEKLISFDTTSRNSNLDLMGFIEGYLEDHGVSSRLLPNEDATKANLYATLGPIDAAGGVILSGHTDVVPVDGQPWDTDPFTLKRASDRVFGRGTSDMKGFIATCLAHVPDMLAAPLSEPIHFAFSYDEETGCTGVLSMVDHVAALPTRPRLAIVGEPTRMSVVDAHKGIRAFQTRITGLEGHSSATHQGVNAVKIAAQLISYLAEIEQDLIAAGDPSGRFDPPYTSLSIGPIKGGTALNIIPRDCQFSWEYRCLPSQDEDEVIDRFNSYVADHVLPQMLARAPEQASITTTETSFVPQLTPDAGSAAEVMALMLAGKNNTEAVSYGTEAGHFQNIEVPTVVCGPGDIHEAHTPNEFIEISELAACGKFIRRLIDVLAT